MGGKFIRFVLLVIANFALQFVAIAAEETVKPTFVRESSVQVPRGGDVKITLQAIPSYGNQINFEIQKNPQHGVLSDLTNETDHTATVNYRHDGSRTFLDDFTFRAQAPGRSKSSAARIVIAITPPAPKLVFEAKAVDFGTIILGGTLKTNMVIRNVGGGTVAGTFVVPKGYELPDGAGFSLKEGEATNVALDFTPEETGEYPGSVSIIADCEKEEMRLSGKASPRFDVTSNGPTGCSVSNNSAQQLNISFLGKAPWVMPPSISIPPGESRTVLFLEMDDEDGVPVAKEVSQVNISDGLSSSVFELPPPHGFIPLTLRSEDSDFPKQIPLGDSITVKFSLLNRSQDSRKAEWAAISRSGGGMFSKTPVELKGGEAREVEFVWKPTEPGEATLKVTLDEGLKTHHELLWNVTVTSTLGRDATQQGSLNDSSTSQDSSSESGGTVYTELPKNSPPPGPLESLTWKSRNPWFGKPSIMLRWQPAKETGETYRIEEQVIQLVQSSNGQETGASQSIPPFNVVLLPIDNHQVNQNKDADSVKMDKLATGWHLIVISRISKDGNVTAQSKLQVFMPRSASWWSRWRGPLGVCIVLVLFLFLRKYQGG